MTHTKAIELARRVERALPSGASWRSRSTAAAPSGALCATTGIPISPSAVFTARLTGKISPASLASRNRNETRARKGRLIMAISKYFRVDNELAAQLESDIKKLRRISHKRGRWGWMKGASANDVLRIWLGLAPPRGGVRKRTKAT